MFITLAATSLALATSLTIGIDAAPNVPRDVVKRLVDEASAIWKDAGFTFAWLSNGTPAVHVTINDDTGLKHESGEVPLGWVLFSDEHTPANVIHLSYSNTIELIRRSVGFEGGYERLPRVERYTLMGRALGRALAHELGHYLTGSQDHAGKGLMRARRAGGEFLGPGRFNFRVERFQRRLVAERMLRDDASERSMASRSQSNGTAPITGSAVSKSLPTSIAGTPSTPSLRPSSS